MEGLLGQLRMCELLERARAMGAPQDVLDELMDSSDPRQALTRMLRERTMQAEEGELGRLVGRLRDEATVLATAARLPEKNDQRHIRALETLSTMVDELATARGPDVALELACMQVPQTIIAARLAVSALLSLPRCLAVSVPPRCLCAAIAPI
jgi:hypothetical protein